MMQPLQGHSRSQNPECETRPAPGEENARSVQALRSLCSEQEKQTFNFLINILQPSNKPSNYSFYMPLTLMTS